MIDLSLLFKWRKTETESAGGSFALIDAGGGGRKPQARGNSPRKVQIMSDLNKQKTT